MINLSVEKKLNIITTNTNKALSKVLEDLTPQALQKFTTQKDISSILDSIFKQSNTNTQQDKELLKLLKNNPTLKELSTTNKTITELKSSLDEILQSSTKPLQTDIKSKLQNLQKILQEFEKPPTLKNDAKSLEKSFQNSGIFLESKIKNLENPKEQLSTLLQKLSQALSDSKVPQAKELNTQIKLFMQSDLFTQDQPKNLNILSSQLNRYIDKTAKIIDSSLDKSIHPKDTLFTKETKELLNKIEHLNKPQKLSIESAHKELFTQDLKAVVLQTKEELQNNPLANKQELIRQLDKLSMQIDYYQLLSHLSNASALYIPYSWSELEDGNITLSSNNKDAYFCDIELQLKEYGELKLRLGLFEKNQLNINITTESDILESILKENINTLKKQLFEVGLHPKEIRFLNAKKESSSYIDNLGLMDMGFEVKV